MRRFKMSGNSWVLITFAVLLAIGGWDFAQRQARSRTQTPEVDASCEDPQYVGRGHRMATFTAKDAAGVGHDYLTEITGRHRVLLFFCGCNYCQNLSKFIHALEAQPGVSKIPKMAVASFQPSLEPSFREAAKFDDLIVYPDDSKTFFTAWAGEPCPRIYVAEDTGRMDYLSVRCEIHMPGLGVKFADYLGIPRETTAAALQEVAAATPALWELFGGKLPTLDDVRTAIADVPIEEHGPLGPPLEDEPLDFPFDRDANPAASFDPAVDPGRR